MSGDQSLNTRDVTPIDSSNIEYTTAHDGIENLSNGNENQIIEQLSLKLLQQSELTNNLQHHIATLNTQVNQLKSQLVQSRKEKHEADLEVTRLSTEVENITQELFEQANIQVAEANQDAFNIKQLNERLVQTIKEKDTTIEILQAELVSLKEIITNNEHVNKASFNDQQNSSTPDMMMIQQSKPQIPENAYFKSELLQQYNDQLIYSPVFNQIRFDLPPFILFSEALAPQSTEASKLTYDLKSSKFYTKLLEELEDTLRLDKAPALQSLKLRWNKKTFLQDLMDKNVNIQPLSAATEVWKSQTLQKYIPTIPQGQTDENLQLSRVATISQNEVSYDPEMFSLATNTNSKEQTHAAPLALVTCCSLCGEKRKDLNFSRLYHLRFEASNDDKSKLDYPLCINCANKYRAVVELLKFVSSLNPLDLPANIRLDDYIRASWLKFVQLKSKFWHAANIGIWNEKEMFGLVYGWENSWLTSYKSMPKEIEVKRSNEIHRDTVQDDPETTPILSKQKSKGWNGWSDIIAQSPNNTDIKVEIDVGTNSKTKKDSDRSISIDRTEMGSESTEDVSFHDANYEGEEHQQNL
ncbi:hypothetical protein CANINC_001065 [Pichia inconspicua]|uniref:GDP/GTP exchange factor Sec2 N-terminal domain-containing protein n=1 Tax=Pichia inconspicua TaxID=52247 RepID=A0A4T0X522_9ASCO|nr:hypothetical protein CANINC_001065 [[Candida] inconspicua]